MKKQAWNTYMPDEDGLADRAAKSAFINFYGTSKDDRMVTTAKADSVQSLGGNDIVNAKGGNDRVWGGNGNDTLKGGAGKDELIGDKGNDVLIGGAGNDTLFGEQGHDYLFGGAGNDTLIGEKGNDTYVISGGYDTLWLGILGSTRGVNAGIETIIVEGNGQLFDLTADDIFVFEDHAFAWDDLPELIVENTAKGAVLGFGDFRILVNGITSFDI